MRPRRSFAYASSAAAVVVATMATGPASAGADPGAGLTHFQLAEAGWDCFVPAPPASPDFNRFVHCSPPGTLAGFLAGTAQSARFITFDTTDLTMAGPMLGTERDLRGDLYRLGGAQKCNTDPDNAPYSNGEWSHIESIFGLDYYTCHTFDSPW